MKAQFVLLVLLYGVPCIFCACHQTPIIECDSIEDLKNKDFPIKHKIADWSVLKVGNVEHPPLKAVKLSDIITPKFFTYTETFMIVGQINNLIPEDFGYCGFQISALKVLSFYKNDLKEGFDLLSFPIFNLDKLLLIDNNIHKLKSGALSRQEVKLIDLSNNQLKTLDSRSLPYDAKKIIINNNKLREIHPEAFGPQLEELSLNYNNLESIKNEILSNLPMLKKVLLRHNKLTAPTDIIQHPSVQYLDLSHNKMEQLEAVNVNKKLKELDLGFNDILEASDFLNSIIKTKTNEEKIQVSLAFNKLKSLNILNSTSKDEIEVRFYGNPWDCNFWEEKKSLMTPLLGYWDRDLFNTNTVYCMDYAKTNLTYETDEGKTVIKQWIQDLYKQGNVNPETAHLYLDQPTWSTWCVA